MKQNAARQSQKVKTSFDVPRSNFIRLVNSFRRVQTKEASPFYAKKETIYCREKIEANRGFAAIDSISDEFKNLRKCSFSTSKLFREFSCGTLSGKRMLFFLGYRANLTIDEKTSIVAEKSPS